MNIEETVNNLANGQAGHEARIGSLEAAFKSVAQSLQMLIEMTTAHEERLDGHDEAIKHTDEKLDALIDSDIKLRERFEALAAAQIEQGARFDAMVAKWDQMAVVQAEHSTAIRALLERAGQ